MYSEEILLQIIFWLTVYQILIFFASLAADYQLFGKTGRRKWLGLIPVVNDFVLYDAFWKRPLFFLYEACYWVSWALNKFPVNGTDTDDLIGIAANSVMLFLLIGLYDRLRRAFDKNFLWVTGLAVCYPLFVILLVKTGVSDAAYVKAARKTAEPE